MNQLRGAELGDLLLDIARRVVRLAEAVTVDWPDARGREWAERAAQLHRELIQQAATAVELGGRTGRPSEGSAAGMRTRGGVRLGGTEGHRVDEERGVRIGELPPP